MGYKIDWGREAKSFVVLSIFVLNTCNMAQIHSKLFFFKIKNNKNYFRVTAGCQDKNKLYFGTKRWFAFYVLTLGKLKLFLLASHLRFFNAVCCLRWGTSHTMQPISAHFTGSINQGMQWRQSWQCTQLSQY